jgi:anti-anti-sigma factor
MNLSEQSPQSRHRAAPSRSRGRARTHAIPVIGELDSLTSPVLAAEITRHLGRRPDVLLLDLTRLNYLGVAGLAMLLRARSEAERANTDLVLTGRLSSAVARMLSLVGWSESECPAMFPAALPADQPDSVDRPYPVHRTGHRSAERANRPLSSVDLPG